MIYKFLLFPLFLCLCISVAAQELQSPQISQNAIFANSGLAGSKGQTRICTALTMATDPGYSKLYNGLVSMDGLILKNKIGIGGYLKNEFYKINNTYTNDQSQTFTYTNMYMGVMFAPKFHIGTNNIKKPGRTFSPAIGFGLKATQFDYTGFTFTNSSGERKLYYDGLQDYSINMDFISLSLLYSSPRSFVGVKFNVSEYHSNFYLHDASITLARSYYNSKVSKPDFSFNPQFYFSFPIYALNYSLPDWGYLDYQNKNVMNSFAVINLDFRYKKIIMGSFFDWTIHSEFYGGLTGGIQSNTMKIVINYAHKLSKTDDMNNGLFLSANFYIKAKKNNYQ